MTTKTNKTKTAKTNSKTAKPVSDTQIEQSILRAIEAAHDHLSPRGEIGARVRQYHHSADRGRIGRAIDRMLADGVLVTTDEQCLNGEYCLTIAQKPANDTADPTTQKPIWQMSDAELDVVAQGDVVLGRRILHELRSNGSQGTEAIGSTCLGMIRTPAEAERLQRALRGLVHEGLIHQDENSRWVLTEQDVERRIAKVVERVESLPDTAPTHAAAYQMGRLIAILEASEHLDSRMVAKMLSGQGPYLITNAYRHAMARGTHRKAIDHVMRHMAAGPMPSWGPTQAWEVSIGYHRQGAAQA